MEETRHRQDAQSSPCHQCRQLEDPLGGRSRNPGRLRPDGRPLRRQVSERLRPRRRAFSDRQLGRPVDHQLYLRFDRRPERRDADLPEFLGQCGLQPAQRACRRQDGVDAADGPYVRPGHRVHLSAVQRHLDLLAGQGPDACHPDEGLRRREALSADHGSARDGEDLQVESQAHAREADD